MISILTWFMIFFSFLFVFELKIMLLLLYLFLMIVSISLMIFFTEMVSWFSFLVLIFLIGGLMISFMYMVSLSHNNSMHMKNFMLMLLVSMLFSFIMFSSLDLKNLVFYLVENKDMEKFWISYSFIYMVQVFFLFIYLTFVLIIVDLKLKFSKGNMKEII
uniref:NADH dehydrogenase subunit 6 n=1 Tax=Liposcelis paeta TaxID=209927 RepID=A0A096X738_9NEOP|nr:NADH dehydrogenase subunit 6 [Liposcelis paeta]